MGKVSKPYKLCLLLVALLLTASIFNAPVLADSMDQKEAKAEAKAKMRLKEKAEQAEKLEKKKEEAERKKREEAELAKQKAEARAKAKAEAEKLAAVDAEAKAQTQAEISEAKSVMEAQMADLKSQKAALAAEYDAKKAQLKDKYAADKAAAVDDAAKAKLADEYAADLATLNQQQQQQNQAIADKMATAQSNYNQVVAKAQMKARHAVADATIASLNFPEDNTPVLTAREVQIKGNTLIDTAEILSKMPVIWSASGVTLTESEPGDLYDFRGLSKIIMEPGPARQVSARTIQGFTLYVLSVYQEYSYAGIYVYVPRSTMVGANQLQNDILVIEVLEAPVTEVTVRSYDPDQNMKEEGYLKRSYIEKWSPVQSGAVANQKELDDFVNLLNQNPDRYVSATVTRGAKPNSLAVEYDIYEATPWHWFIQIDNSGTQDRQWTPRIGVINTNLLGIDDTFSVIFQAPWESDFAENYALYGSYDLPIMGPKLRFNAYAGYSEFDTNPDAGPFDFIGNGSFVGGILRYNAIQTESDMPLLGKGWFFDIKGMVEYTRSKVTPSLFPTQLGSDVRFWMWGWGLELHKKDDMSQSSFSFDRWESWGGQTSAGVGVGPKGFVDARAGASSDFSIYDFKAAHSQFIDPNKIQRVAGSFRWVLPNERLVPAKMTSFGGMYTVRGYDESEIVADGGMLASIQYEYDYIAAEKAVNPPVEEEGQEENKYEIKRLAPLVFLDYGRTTIRRAGTIAGESRHDEMLSVGVGCLLDVGNHLSGAVYYGHPLIKTVRTREGKGRVNASFRLIW